MKTFFSIPFTLAFLFILSSCTKEGCMDPDAINYDKTAVRDDGVCIYKGKVNFFLSEDCNCEGVDIWVNDKYKGRISDYTPSGKAECGKDKGLTVELDEGIHKARAKVAGDSTGGGTLTVENFLPDRQFDYYVSLLSA